MDITHKWLRSAVYFRHGRVVIVAPGFCRLIDGRQGTTEPFHLDKYVTEQVFRYNNRATKDNPPNDATDSRWRYRRLLVGGTPRQWKKLGKQWAEICCAA